jgi:DNA-directed RNA polymerase subunit F
MEKPEIISEIPISMAELKDQLSKLKKKNEELNFSAEKAIEYLNNFDIESLKKTGELREKLEKLKVPRLKEEHVVKIIDLMPGSLEELKLILSGYTLTVTNDNLKKIVDCVKKHKE